MDSGLFQQIEDELRIEDEATRPERCRRALFIAQLGQPEDGWGFYGEGVVVPWSELRSAYVEGHFQSAVLIGQAFLENLLGGLVDFHEPLDGRDTLLELLEGARDLGWLLPSEFESFDELRLLRNPYAHYRKFNQPDSLLTRAIARDVEPEEVLRGDCEQFLNALYSFVNRRFGLGPIVRPGGLEPHSAARPGQRTLELD